MTIPNSVTAIGNYAFEGCTGLTEVTIPNSVTTIGGLAFAWCEGLTVVTIPNSVTTIGWRAFDDCTSLTEVTVPASVTDIGYFAFSEHTTLVVEEDSAAHAWAVENERSYRFIFIDRPDLAVFGTTLTLYNDISVNYMVRKELFDGTGYTNPYMVLTFNGKPNKVTQYTEVDEYYCFSFDNVAPYKMNNTIASTLYASVGNTLVSSKTTEYSIAEYCYSMLEDYSADEYAELRTLLVDLLNYGADTQAYTGHNAEELVNARLTEEQKAWASPERARIDNELNSR